MRRIGWLAAAAALTCIGLATEASAQTTSGAQSLNITPGARADAMGRAFVALPEDATANWWNPAALAWRREKVVSLMHAKLVPDLAPDVYYEYLGYSMHLAGWGGIGATVIYLGYGESDAVTEDGRTLGAFTSYEISPQVSIGTELAPGFAAGMTLKYVYVDLAPDWATEDEIAGTGDTFAADLALFWRLNDTVDVGIPINFALNLQNLGPKIAYIQQDEADPIGRNLKVGLAARLYGGEGKDFDIIGSYDFNQSLIHDLEETPIQNMGAEFSYRRQFALRAGYIHDSDGAITAPTFGAGFEIGRFTVDYASVPQAEGLDRVNKFSISYDF
ncbi:MAG: PorV/PorQ family protein [Candidatus Eisenbacteria bacterium]